MPTRYAMLFLTAALFLQTSCGSNKSDKHEMITRYVAKFPIFPTTSARLNTVVDYDRDSGAVSIAKYSLATPPVVQNSNVSIASESSKSALNTILEELDPFSYDSEYRSEDGAESSDGTPMDFTFYTSKGEKNISIDTIDFPTLPSPLRDLYQRTILFGFFDP